MQYGRRGTFGLARARERRDAERGQILVLFAGAVVVLMVLAAIVIDVGLLRTDGARLQNALDAGALAAAHSLPAKGGAAGNVAAVRAAATDFARANYPGMTGPDTTFACLIGVDVNGLPRVTDMPTVCNVSLAATSAAWRCTGAVCWAPCDPTTVSTDICNTVILKDSVVRPYTFGRAVGVDSGSTGTLQSAACTGACGGRPTTPVDVVLTIDRTGSMSGLESTLVAGAHAVLKAYDPDVQHIALGMIGPSSQVTACSTGAFGKVLVNGTNTPSIANSNTTNVRSAANATGGAATLRINKPTATVDGDLLVVGISFSGGAATTITPPDANWHQILRTTNTNVGASLSMASYYKVAAGEPTYYDFQFSPNARASGGMLRYTGVDISNPIGPSAGSFGNDTNSPFRATAPTVNTAANTAVVGFYGMSTATAFTANSALTRRFDISAPNTAGPAGPATQGATGTQNGATSGTDYASMTAGGGGQWVAQHFTVNPIPGENYPVGYPTTNPPYTEAFITASMPKWIPVGLTGTEDAKVLEPYLNADGTVRASSKLAKTIGCVLPPNDLYMGTDQASPFDFAWRYLRDNARIDPKTGKHVKTGIIFETDGTPQTQNYTCAQAQLAAKAARDYGVEVYTIGFFASNSPGTQCPDSSGTWRGKTIVQSLAAMATDSATIRTNACDTVANSGVDENTDGDHFYCTPTASQLDDVFRAAAIAMASGSRLIQLYPQPVVSSVSPSSETGSAGGNTIQIGGRFFTEAYSVTFDGTPAASFHVNSDTSITAVSPDGPASTTVDIQVSTPGGSSNLVAADHYSFGSP